MILSENLNSNITVFVLSHNRPQYLPDAIESILNQTKKPREIIILDNGSTNDVKQSIQKYLKDGVIWVGSDKSNSVFWNIKRTKNRTDSKYIFIMHDDDRLCYNFLEKQIQFLERNPNIISVGCNGYLINNKGNRFGYLVTSKKRKEIEFYHSIYEIISLYSSGQCIPFPSIVYRTEFWNAIDFKKELGPGTDMVFLCELVKLGIIAYQPTILFQYRMHTNQGSKSLNEDVYKKIENFYKRNCRNNPALYKIILSNISKAKTRRFLDKWKWYLVKKKLIRSLAYLFFIMRKSWFDWHELIFFSIGLIFKFININEQKKKKIIQKYKKNGDVLKNASSHEW